MATTGASKVVQVKRPGDSVWLTLPGGTGEMSREAASIEDTIYGNPYMSQEVGLIGWTLTGNAFFKGFAGYKAELRRAVGAAVAMAADTPLTRIGSTQRYKSDITEAGTLLTGSDLFARRYAPEVRDIWSTVDASGNPATYVFEDGSTPIPATSIKCINYLHGEVEFVDGYAPTGTVSVTGGFYYITQNLANAMSFTLGQTVDAVENTTFPVAQENDGFRTFQYGLKDVTLEVGGIYRSDPNWVAALTARDTILIDISPDGEGKSSFRGYFNLMTQSQSGDVGALEEESLSFKLQVPSSDYVPISWIHQDNRDESGLSVGDRTTLHQSVRDILDAFENNRELDVRYLHDGTNGWSGRAIVTDCGLESGLEAMNTFNATFQGSGVLATV